MPATTSMDSWIVKKTRTAFARVVCFGCDVWDKDCGRGRGRGRERERERERERGNGHLPPCSRLNLYIPKTVDRSTYTVIVVRRTSFTPNPKPLLIR